MESPEHNRESVAEPWSPRHIGILAIVCSPLPAAVVHALNWRRLGQPERVRRELAKNSLAVGLFAAVVVMDALPRIAVAALTFGFAGYFVATQLPSYDSVLGAGGKRASFLRPSLYSVAGIVGALVLLLGGERVANTVELRRLDTMLANGEYEAYESAMLKWLEDDPGDAAANWNLALVYSEMDRWPEVAEHLRRYNALRPSDEEGAQWLREVELYLDDPEGYPASTDVPAR